MFTTSLSLLSPLLPPLLLYLFLILPYPFYSFFLFYTILSFLLFFFFFFNDTAPPEIYPLPLHDALPISHVELPARRGGRRGPGARPPARRHGALRSNGHAVRRSGILAGPMLVMVFTYWAQEIGRAHV